MISKKVEKSLKKLIVLGLTCMLVGISGCGETGRDLDDGMDSKVSEEKNDTNKGEQVSQNAEGQQEDFKEESSEPEETKKLGLEEILEISDRNEKIVALYEFISEDEPRSKEALDAWYKIAFSDRKILEVSEEFRKNQKEVFLKNLKEEYCKYAQYTYIRDYPDDAEKCAEAYGYDENNRIIYHPYGIEGYGEKFYYDEQGRWTGTDYGDSQERAEYDESGRLVKVKFDGFAKDIFRYNDQGWILTEADDYGVRIEYQYNDDGDLVKLVHKDDKISGSSDYDENLHYRAIMEFGEFEEGAYCPYHVSVKRVSDIDKKEKYLFQFMLHGGDFSNDPSDYQDANIKIQDMKSYHFEDLEEGDEVKQIAIPHLYGDGFMDVNIYTIGYKKEENKVQQFLYVDKVAYKLFYLPTE